MSMQAVADAKRRYEEAVGHTDAVKVAACVMTTSGPDQAMQKALAHRLGERARRTIKALVPGATLDNSGLENFGPEIGTFMASLRLGGVFERLEAGALRVPLRPGRVVINSTVFMGSEAEEAAAKKVQAIELMPADFVPKKCVSQIVLSKTLIDGLW